MKPEHDRLLRYLDKVLTELEDIICDTSVTQEEKQEVYNRQIAILDKFSLVKE